ncbi:MAG: glycosyltransferase family 4 protein [Ilumatobacter sp.]|nr:glycosyltransferase family 4 protein [Ilumatobacter sp.]
MRALVIHNFYRSENASGENLSVLDEVAALRERGWDVEILSADSDTIAGGAVSVPSIALRPIYSTRSVRRTTEAIQRFRPHVALVENLFPMHSPWVVRTLHAAGVPVAAGVRSYRMWCAASTMFRDGRPCNECVGSVANLPAVRHGCYQQSPIRSVPMAASLAVHRSTFRAIEAFLAVTQHVADELVAAGMPSERIIVRPNFVPDPGPSPDVTGAGFMFAGRLTSDKGVNLMVDAWRASNVWRGSTLRIAGSGELRPSLDALDAELNVEPLGLVEHGALMEMIRTAAVMVVPSVWPEPFGRVVIEAASVGRPSLVTAAGGLASLVVDGVTGWIAEPTVDQLAAGFRRAADLDAQLAAGPAARQRYLERYTSDVSVGILDDTLARLAERGVDLTR